MIGDNRNCLGGFDCRHTHVAPSSRTGFALYDKTAYFTTWFKTGIAPQVTRDALYYSSRRHRTDTPATAAQTPSLFTITPGYDVQNEVEVTAFLKEAGTLQIEIAGNVTSIEAAAGVTSFSVPMDAGVSGRPVFRLKRGNHVILEGAAQAAITSDVVFQDMLYWSGAIFGSSAP